MESWFEWSKKRGLGIERIEDLILVSGRTLVTSWGAAVFLDHGQEETAISLAVHTVPNGGGRFVWRLINRLVPHRNSQLEPVCSPDCVKSSCTDLSSQKGQFIAEAEPMCLHQGIPSETWLSLVQTHSGCCRTPPR